MVTFSAIRDIAEYTESNSCIDSKYGEEQLLIAILPIQGSFRRMGRLFSKL